MLDFIPPQVWLIVMLSVAAWGPGVYVWDHLTHSSTARDITQPPEYLIWKSGKRLWRSLALLAGLFAIGVFAFTPWAESFAESGWLPPAVLGLIGSVAIGSAVNGWKDGEVSPLIRGVSQTYSRDEQPKRYWASLGWNALLGAALSIVALGISRDNITPDCDDYGDNAALLESIAACDAMLAESGLDAELRADLLGDRGRVHHRLGNDELALRDYSSALDLDPEDSYALYNRGLIHTRMSNLSRAVEDYSASLALRPDNSNAYFERGRAYMDLRRFEEAIVDFDQLYARDPDNPFVLANRGIAHAWLGSPEDAERDFQRVNQEDPGWPVVLRGRALLAFNRGDYLMAIDYLSQALEIDSLDNFSLRMRAEAYWRIGERDLARDDVDRYMASQTSPPRAIVIKP